MKILLYNDNKFEKIVNSTRNCDPQECSKLKKYYKLALNNDIFSILIKEICKKISALNIYIIQINYTSTIDTLIDIILNYSVLYSVYNDTPNTLINNCIKKCLEKNRIIIIKEILYILLPINKTHILILTLNTLNDSVNIINSICHYLDILDFSLKLKEIELNRLKEEQKRDQELLNLKDTFIATMSHEIRTPLNGIVGMSRLLQDSKVDEKQTEWLKILYSCSIQLMELVNDILDFTKIVSGNFKLNTIQFNLRDTINSVLDIIKPKAKDKNLEVVVSIDDSVINLVNGDQLRLKQILINILGNAVKFTEKGSIKLIVKYANNFKINDNKYSNISFQVIDTGIGISEKNKKNLFQIFNKFNNNDPTNHGVGMGLAITKKLIELMNGTITVNSELGKGSTFTIILPFEDEEKIKLLLQQNLDIFKDKIIYLYANNENDRINISEILWSWSLKTYTFSSNRELLSFKGNNPNIVIIVNETPTKNEQNELIQGLREKKINCPILLITDNTPSVRNKLTLIDDYLNKNFTKSSLFNIILKLLIKSTTKNKRLSMQVSKFDQTKILIAEDDPYNQILLKEILKKFGYKNIITVNNGLECVNKTKEISPDVIFMDIKMPLMNGLEATRIIKNTENPPIIIAVTASVLESDKNSCFDAGCDAYVPKPYTPEKINTTLLNFTEKN